VRLNMRGRFNDLSNMIFETHWRDTKIFFSMGRVYETNVCVKQSYIF